MNTSHPTSSTSPQQTHSGSQIGRPRIKVLGLGGGGSNAVNRMIQLGLEDVDFIAANTDKQALASSLAPVRLQIGPRVTRGLGAGGDPKAGAAAAMESAREIAEALQGADLVFITAGMGGGTGTGSAPVAAEIAREIGAVVVAIVTLPFTFEMGHRSNSALEGVKQLQPHSHTMITVPNDRLLQVVPKELSLEVAFRLADDVLRQGVQGITELVTRPGLINVDFAHVRELLLHGGGALMSIGIGEGQTKSSDAVQQALNHPLLEIQSLDQATGVLAHFTGGDDLTLHEVSEAVTALHETLSEGAEVILGASTDPAFAGRTQAILVVTGLGGRPVSPSDVGIFHSGDRETAEADSAEADLDLPTFLRRRLSVR